MSAFAKIATSALWLAGIAALVTAAAIEGGPTSALGLAGLALPVTAVVFYFGHLLSE